MNDREIEEKLWYQICQEFPEATHEDKLAVFVQRLGEIAHQQVMMQQYREEQMAEMEQEEIHEAFEYRQENGEHITKNFLMDLEIDLGRCNTVEEILEVI